MRRSPGGPSGGERDWALSNRGRRSVSPGDLLTASAWVRAEGEGSVSLAIVGLREGEVVSWRLGEDRLEGGGDWTLLQAAARVRRYVDEVYVRFTGRGSVRAWLDDVALAEGWPEPPAGADKPRVEGWAAERVKERLGRGLVVIPLDGGRIYLSWRLLDGDPDDVAFDVYRRAGDGEPAKLTDEPITRTCDFIDESPEAGVENEYTVRAVGGEMSAPASATPSREGRPYLSIPLQGDYTFQRVGIGDLDGDGAYDFVIKQPNANVDPYEEYWYASPETYKLEAYLADGTFLWSRDLGWGIERGVWYSPMLVYDFDGDGRAEVAVKTAPEEDLRDDDGRVTTGPEWLSILDGMTGEELARADWPSREGFARYNYYSRNLMCVAYLDGRTPCIVIDRGTYGTMKVDAWQFHDGRLTRLWRWTDDEGGGLYRGQGAHSMHAADIDGDGRDEVFLGSAVIDDNGVGLWSTGMGHCDHHYVGDIDPTRPGLEVYYGYETAQPSDGCCLFDARTGRWLWGLDEPTKHVHASGMCADIDPGYPGLECYSGERDFPDKKWLRSAQGELIEMIDLGGLSPRSCYWDADLQRELIRGSRIYDFRGGVHRNDIEGRIMGFADVLGDWREELIATVPGEIRIYTTTIPAADRRVCLMQDPIYRMDVAIQAMGYTQCPMTTNCLSAGQANLSALVEGGRASVGEETAATLIVTAPADRPLRGTVVLQPDRRVTLDPERVEVEVPAGQIARYPLRITLAAVQPAVFGRTAAEVTARYQGDGGPLETTLRVEPRDEPLVELPRVQAEEIAAQGGGAVQIRDDKVGPDGLCFSHWDDAGHWIEWTLPVAEDGRYVLAARYCATDVVRRAAAIDGEPVGPGEFSFPATGGYSAAASDWAHDVLRRAGGEPLVLKLQAGEHRLRMTNVDDRGMNLDYLLLYPAD